MKSDDWHAGFVVGWTVSGFLFGFLYTALDFYFHGFVWQAVMGIIK